MRRLSFRVAGLFAAWSTMVPACLNPAVLASTADAADEARDGGRDITEGSDGGDGHGDLDDHVGPPGDGSATNLHVDGTFEAMNSSDNAQDAAGFETRVTLRIGRVGGPIGDAMVSVTGDGVTTSLAQIGGTFVGSIHGYAASYVLDIAGDGFAARGLALAGPAAHAFSVPTSGQTVRAGAALPVAWAPSGAQAATIETDAMPETAVVDSGGYTVAGSALPGEPGRVDPDRIRVRRRSLVNVPGVQDGSTVEFEVRNDVGIMVDAR